MNPNSTFMAGLKEESEEVWKNVSENLKQYAIKSQYDKYLDVNHLDIFASQTKSVQLADVNLLIAENVNMKIDKLFEKLDNNPDLHQKNFASTKEFQQVVMGPIVQELMVLGQQLSDPNSSAGSPVPLLSWFQTLLINRAQKEGKEDYFETLDGGAGLLNSGGI